MADTASQILARLEWRLTRVEFYIKGDVEDSDDALSEDEIKDEPIALRLKRVEERLSKLCADYPLAAELLKLCNRFPKQPNPSLADEKDSDLDAFDKLQVVLSTAPLISQTASQLGSLQEQPLPDTRPLATLASLKSRLTRASDIQEDQLLQIESLRQRSAKVLTLWYQHSLLESDEHWAEWEERMIKIEKAVLRGESARAREAKEI